MDIPLIQPLIDSVRLRLLDMKLRRFADAIERGDATAVQEFLDSGTPTDLLRWKGLNHLTTPLGLAVESGHRSIVKMLLTHGADPAKPHINRQFFLSHMTATKLAVMQPWSAISPDGKNVSPEWANWPGVDAFPQNDQDILADVLTAHLAVHDTTVQSALHSDGWFADAIAQDIARWYQQRLALDQRDLITTEVSAKTAPPRRLKM